MKSSSRDGLLAHSTGCDMNLDDDDGSTMDVHHMDDPVNVFPHKISTSTLKSGSSRSKRTFLLKEKRESIVWEMILSSSKLIRTDLTVSLINVREWRSKGLIDHLTDVVLYRWYDHVSYVNTPLIWSFVTDVIMVQDEKYITILLYQRKSAVINVIKSE